MVLCVDLYTCVCGFVDLIFSLDSQGWLVRDRRAIPDTDGERESNSVNKDICVNLIIVSVQSRPIICDTSNARAC